MTLKNKHLDTLLKIGFFLAGFLAGLLTMRELYDHPRTPQEEIIEYNNHHKAPFR